MPESLANGLLLRSLRDPSILVNLPEADWRDVLDCARDAGLLARLQSLLADRRELGQIPEKVRVQLEEARSFVRRNQTDIRFEANRVARALKGLEVPIVLLKGAAYLIADLPAAGRHIAADLDILVPKDRLGAVERTLLAAGWQRATLSDYDERYYRDWMHEIPPLWHPERLFAVDIHHSILPTTSRYQPNVEALFAAAIQTDQGSLRVLCPADLVLHAAAHLFTEEFVSGLRQIADLRDLFEHFGREQGFWDDLLTRSRLHRLERILYYALRYTSRLLDTKIPNEVRAAADGHRPNVLARAIMDAAVISAVRPPALGETRPGRRLALAVLRARSHWLKMPPLLLARHLMVKTGRALRNKVRLPSAKTAASTN